MEQAQCKGMLACEEGAAPCCTPLSLGAAHFMSNTLLQGGHRTLGDDVEAIPSFSHFALDLGGKEESGRTAERERRDGWDSCIIKAQMLGLSTATLGWSRCLQRTQSLFCIFSFFSPFFPPLNLSVGHGGGRRILKPLFSAGCLMHHCCNAVLEMVTELEFCVPLSRVPVGWQGQCCDRCCPGALSSRTVPCFLHPTREG